MTILSNESPFLNPSPDLRDCPQTCSARWEGEHRHCISDGKVLFAEGGGGDDGLSIGGWTDAIFCERCHELICDNRECAPMVDGQEVCVPCKLEIEREQQDEVILEAGVAHLSMDVIEVRKQLMKAHPSKVQPLLAQIRQLAVDAGNLPGIAYATVERAQNLALPLRLAS